MPVDGSSTELLNVQNSSKKKRSNKKRRQQRKIHSKNRLLDGQDVNDPSSSSNVIKTNLRSNHCDINKLTPANLASLRWENILTDPALENERIERYKELRRQRYIDAREQAIQAVFEQIHLTTANDSTHTAGNEQQ